MEEAQREGGRAGVAECRHRGGRAVGVAERVEGALGLEDDVEGRGPGRPRLGVVRPRSGRASRRTVRPNGAQPSPSSTARRSDRAVRPPIQIGTSASARRAGRPRTPRTRSACRGTTARARPKDARSARIASSARAPRSSNGAPSSSNSSRERPDADAEDQPTAATRDRACRSASRSRAGGGSRARARTSRSGSSSCAPRGSRTPGAGPSRCRRASPRPRRGRATCSLHVT